MSFANLSIYEIIMLLCFGFAWPFSIVKSYRSQSTKGKSLLFLVALQIGYVSGILHKYFYKRDLVMILYLINLIMVSIDVALYFRNRRLEKNVKPTTSEK
jgi:hypothetical protein